MEPLGYDQSVAGVLLMSSKCYSQPNVIQTRKYNIFPSYFISEFIPVLLFMQIKLNTVSFSAFLHPYALFGEQWMQPVCSFFFSKSIKVPLDFFT